MNSESIRYVNAIRRWWWLVVLAAALAGGGAYYWRHVQPEIYHAEARIFIGNIENPNIDTGSIQTGASLAPIFAEIARSYEVLEATIERAQIDVTPLELSAQVSTYSVPETPILVVSANDPDPARAVAIATALTESLIINSPGYLNEEEQAQMEVLRNQVNELEQQIAITRQQSLGVLEDLNAAIQEDSTREITRLSDLYNRLVDQVNTARATLAQSSDTLLQLANRTTRIEIIEQARVENVSTSGIKPVIAGAAGAVVGVLLAIGLLLFFEYADGTVRYEDVLEEGLELPVIGSISRSRAIRKHPLITFKKPDHVVVEQFRNVRANLLARHDPHRTYTYLIASSHFKEGRTVFAMNLAMVLAEAEMRVLLIDADLRSPNIHTHFNLRNHMGLKQILESSPVAATQNEQINSILKIQESRTSPNLFILTSGTEGYRGIPASVLSFNALERWLQIIQRTNEFDLILIDTPPASQLADTYTIASKIKANIILLAEKGRTSHNELHKVKERLDTTISVPVGIVMNKV